MTTLFYPKPRAVRDLSTDKHGVIEASAGTGKTYTLQHLVVDILLSDEAVRLDEILVVTFTVAATSDLKQKIREILKGLIEKWEKARRLEYERAVADGELCEADADETFDETDWWALDREAVDDLRHAVRNFDRAAIYTIHGFCQRILVEYAFENRRLFEQEHVSEEAVIEEAFSEMLREDIRPGTDAELWLTAYLGAGNSIDELRDKLSEYVRCDGEYRPRFDEASFVEAVGQFADDVEAVGFDSWRQQVPEEVSSKTSTLKAIATNRGPALYEAVADVDRNSAPKLLRGIDADASDAIKYLLGDSPQQVLAAGGPVSEPLQAVLEHYVGFDIAVVNVLGRVLGRRIEQVKARQGYFTFDDMVRVVRDQLVDGDSAEQLLASIRAQFRYGLIDEFQDTDRHQWEIFETIFVDSPEDGAHFLYLIGDPKQAIYGFRGGNVYTYLEACDRLESRPDAEEPTSLTENFRSTQAVIDAYNDIFDAEVAQPVELGEGIGYEPGGVGAGKPDLALLEHGEPVDRGMVAFELTTNRDKEPSKAHIERGIFERYADEIARVAGGESNLQMRTEEGDVEEIGPEHIFVLARRRKQLHAIAEALRARGVDFAFLKMPGLFDTQEAMDVYDLLVALDAPFDRSRRVRAWMTPFFDLRLRDLEGIGRLDESEPMFEKLVDWSRRARRGEFTELFDVILRESGLLRRRFLLERGERELTNYLHVFETLADEAARGVRTVEDLARRLKAFIDGRTPPGDGDTEQQRLETEEAAVQLLTIHGAKGLQRGVVFVIPNLGPVARNGPYRFHDVDDRGRRYPVVWHDSKKQLSARDKARVEREAAAEERRLAYVAITRAELMVYVPHVPKDSVLHGKLKSDPFSQIWDRLEALRDHSAIEFCSADIDVPTREPVPEQVEATLGALPPVDEIPGPEIPDPQRLEALRSELLLRRWEVTSYSKLKKRVRTSHTEEEKGDEDAPTGVLPGGMATGNFLHRVLEELDYSLVDEFDRDEWRSDEEIRELFEASAGRFGRFDDEAIERAMDVVYDALRAEVDPPDGPSFDGIRRLDPQRVRREMEFLFPVPQTSDGQLRRVFSSGAEIDGGFARGIVDLLFEWEGRLYFADWKSDRAEPFDADALEELVDLRYSQQANLYSLAVCRMLGISTEEEYDEHFGGYFYFFVRGMSPDEPERGIYGGKVDWEKLVAYENSLRESVREAKGISDAR